MQQAKQGLQRLLKANSPTGPANRARPDLLEVGPRLWVLVVWGPEGRCKVQELLVHDELGHRKLQM